MISNLWTKEKLKWLKENYAKCTYKQMVEYLSIGEDSIRRTAKEELKLERTRYVINGHPRDVLKINEEVMKDLENPRLTSVDLSRKYGVTDSRIQQLRKKHVSWYKPMVNTLARMSEAELKVKFILEELDLAYLLEKRIGKYSIDFYFFLGRKCCIEVQGTYWHNKPERKARDRVKKKFLVSQGYKLLCIGEEELRLKPLVKLKIKQFIRVSLLSNEDAKT